MQVDAVAPRGGRVAGRGDPVAGDDRVGDALAGVLVEHGPGLAIAERVRADPGVTPAEPSRPVGEGDALDVGGEQLGIRGIDRHRAGGRPVRETRALEDTWAFRPAGENEDHGENRCSRGTGQPTAEGEASWRCAAGVRRGFGDQPRPQGCGGLQIQCPKRRGPGALALEGRA